MNKELHSIYVYIDFCQLSIVVSPDLLVTRHFPPRVRGEESALSFPRLRCVSENRSRQQFRRRQWECLQSAQASSASDPSALHTMLRFTSAENVFQACEPATLLVWFFPRGLNATEPLSPALDKPYSSTLLPYLLLLADSQPSQIRHRWIRLINTFVFQLLMAIRHFCLSCADPPVGFPFVSQLSVCGWVMYFCLAFKTAEEQNSYSALPLPHAQLLLLINEGAVPPTTKLGKEKMKRVELVEVFIPRALKCATQCTVDSVMHRRRVVLLSWEPSGKTSQTFPNAISVCFYSLPLTPPPLHPPHTHPPCCCHLMFTHWICYTVTLQETGAFTS